ncbi:MAG: DUF4384 domain-containing protein [Elusimicrobia bacterium]|nr:DUF4384 domain-containing protein [Elusimicrobiota bacterium]
MKLVQLSVIIAALNCPAFAAPEWVEKSGKTQEYPEAVWFVGFGQAMLDIDKDMAACGESAANMAKRRIMAAVLTRMKSEVSAVAQQINGQYAEQVYSSLKEESALDIEGLKTEAFFDNKTKMCSALAGVKKSSLADTYQRKAARLREELAVRMKAGKDAEGRADNAAALDEYGECLRLSRELEEALAVSGVAGGGAGRAFAELGTLETKAGSPAEMTLPQVREAISRLADKPLSSVDDIAWHIAFALRGQEQKKESKVLVSPFTYRDTKMSSPFGRYFKETLSANIARVAKWNIIEAAGPAADLVLAGTYWPQNGKVKFIASLRRVSDSGISAGAEVLAEQRVIDAANLSLRPENFKEAMVDKKAFENGELQGGGLDVEAWTSKGGDNLVFTRGEKMKIYLRVNQPAYVRFIYHLADGKRTLLLDNYYLDSTKVNKVYEVPEEFECAPPFGAETLQVFASTEKFDEIKTEKADGYDILAEDLGRALATSRGFRKAAKAVQKAEVRLVLTTMEK